MPTNLLVAVVVLVMGGGGLAHLVIPNTFAGFVFEPLPALLVVYLTGLMQIGVAAMAMVRPTRHVAGLVFAAICLAYVPLHVWDFFRLDPVISPHAAVAARLALQVAFIWIGVTLWRRRSLHIDPPQEEV